MATIPLPALDVRPPQQEPNLLSQYAQLQQLKNQQVMQPLQQQALQQEVQGGALDLKIKQQQIKDQQAAAASMRELFSPQSTSGTSGTSQQPNITASPLPGATPSNVSLASNPPSLADSTGTPQTAPLGQTTAQTTPPAWPDMHKMIPLMVKNGASPAAVQDMAQKLRQQDLQMSETAKNVAQGGEANVNAQKSKLGMIGSVISGVLNLSDAQLSQGITQGAQQLSSSGLSDPQLAQMAPQLAQLAQTDPASARMQLQIHAASMGAYSQALDDATKQLTLKNEQGKTDPNSPLYAPSTALSQWEPRRARRRFRPAKPRRLAGWRRQRLRCASPPRKQRA